MKYLARKISKRLFPYTVLFTIVATLFILNYKEGTFLTGWDNLHPEFNLQLNIKRSFFAVWQEHQGLGLLGGMGHSADIVRQIIIFIPSLLFPQHLIRYLWTFTMLFVGGAGAYHLIKFVIKKNNLDSPYSTFFSISGSLFYVLNLATIQNFYLPFEAFTAHFAFLPWVLMSCLKYFYQPTKKNLLFFLLATLLSTTSFYIPTIFFVTLLSLLLLTGICWLARPTFAKTMNLVKIFFLIFAVNSFWLLPFLYFTLTNPTVVLQAKINQMSSETTYLRNKESGTIQETTLLKGFWLNTKDFNLEGNYDYIMPSWRIHLENPVTKLISYTFLFIITTGAFFAIRQRKPLLLAFVLLTLISLGALALNTPVLTWFNILLRKFPLISEALRSPFTKFSTTVSLGYSVMFALGLLFIEKNIFRRKGLIFGLNCLIIILTILSSLPAFQGNFIYAREKTKYPAEYEKAKNFLVDQDPYSRIANFPQNKFWGWSNYSFGYNGSGFLWWMIPQSILDRTFDPWSNKNENYYWEISYALYSQNLELFEKVLEKYQINWLLLDENIINPTSPKALYADEFKELVAQSKKIEEKSEFGEITIYKVNLETPVKDFVFLKSDITTIKPAYSWSNYDPGFLDNSYYLTPIRNSKLEIRNFTYYPFRSLFTGKNQENIELDIQETDDSFKFVADVPAEFRNANLIQPEAQEKLLFIDSNDLSKQKDKSSIIDFTQDKITVSVPKIGGYLSAEINSGQMLTLKSKDDNQAYWLPNLPHDRAYIITAQGRNLNGQPAVFWLENPNSRRPDIETYLPKSKHWTTSYFIQPPMEKDGLGYTIHIDNIPVGSDKPANELGKISVYQIPYKLLTHLSLRSREYSHTKDVPTFQQQITNVEHPNPSLYKIRLTDYRLPTTDKLTLVLSQSYDKGWQAYQLSANSYQLTAILAPIFGNRIKNHVLVNNWANGWILEEDTNEVLIIYLPQLLEYAGFALVVLFLIYALKYNRAKI